MKVLFLSQLAYKGKGGLYYATITRISNLIKFNRDIEGVYCNIIIENTYLLNLLFKIKGTLIQKKEETESIIIDECESFEVKVKRGVLDFFLEKFFGIKISEFFIVRKINKIIDNYDIISAHNGSTAGMIAYKLSKTNNRKYVVTFHGSDINIHPYKSSYTLIRTKKLLKESSANIFVSNGLLNNAKSIIDSTKNFYTIYNGIDFNKFKRFERFEVDRLKEYYHLNKKVVGFVGNLVDVKNVMILPLIFQKISLAYQRDVSFLIIGEGILYNQLKEKCDSLNLNIVFISNIDRDELPKIYSMMDIMLLPSKNEGLSLVLIEASACGVRCFASRVGGIPEVIGDSNTLLLDDLFIDKISQRTIEVLDKNDCPIFFNADKFDMVKLAHKEFQLYSKVLRDR